jgi:hypothetical protein
MPLRSRWSGYSRRNPLSYILQRGVLSAGNRKTVYVLKNGPATTLWIWPPLGEVRNMIRGSRHPHENQSPEKKSPRWGGSGSLRNVEIHWKLVKIHPFSCVGKLVGKLSRLSQGEVRLMTRRSRHHPENLSREKNCPWWGGSGSQTILEIRWKLMKIHLFSSLGKSGNLGNFPNS